MPHFRTHEIDIYYESHGDGPALVFAHGAGGNHMVWWQQVPAFAGHYRVITFDHRGFGRSADVPGGPGRRAFPYDLHALLDHLDVEQFAIVAHSMGGRTATPFARMFPGRIRALVLSGTLAGAVNEDVRAIQAKHAETVVGQTLRQRSLGPVTLQQRPDLAYLYRTINLLNPPRPRTFLAPTPGLARRRGSAMHILRTFQMPILFIVGEHDRIVPPAAMQVAHAGLPASHYVEIGDAGHSAYFEQAEEYNDALRAFLGRTWPANGHSATASVLPVSPDAG